jgi:hypothetical protein
MRKQFLIRLVVVSSLVCSSGAWAAQLNISLGGTFQNIFGTVGEFVEVSPVVAGTAFKCSIGSSCMFTGTTITIKLTLTPAAQDFKSWVDPLPGMDANKVCIGGTGLTLAPSTLVGTPRTMQSPMSSPHLGRSRLGMGLANFGVGYEKCGAPPAPVLIKTLPARFMLYLGSKT